MAYTPDWEPLADALKRVMKTDVSEDEAKTDLCCAVADRNIKVQVRIAPNDDRFAGEVFPDRNVKVPRHLSPNDLDWSRSCPLKPWPIGPVGPQNYTWISGWEDRPIDLLELSISDVSIFCGGLANDTDKKGARRTTTAGQENKATHALGLYLKEKPNLTREQAATWCKNQGYTISGRGFQNAVWPNAREKAGLSRRAPAGRKKKSLH